MDYTQLARELLETEYRKHVQTCEQISPGIAPLNAWTPTQLQPLIARLLEERDQAVGGPGVARFVQDGSGQLFWREVTMRPLEDTGCVYLCREPDQDPHIVYKLQKVPGKPAYFWASLWNTAASAGRPGRGNETWQYQSPTIQEAIQQKLDDGWQVKRCTFSDYIKSPF